MAIDEAARTRLLNTPTPHLEKLHCWLTISSIPTYFETVKFQVKVVFQVRVQ
uniref:Uncharacterized protein n=1 Tax=Helianthus annuus TaxID=4232 RepID=A0A251SY37_HELAN